LLLLLSVPQVAAISYPNGFGKFIGGELSTHEQVSHLFTNFTWTQHDLNVEQSAIVAYWTNPYTQDVFTNLTLYLLYTVSGDDCLLESFPLSLPFHQFTVYLFHHHVHDSGAFGDLHTRL